MATKNGKVIYKDTVIIDGPAIDKSLDDMSKDIADLKANGGGIDKVGDLTTLKTNVKDSAVSAINENKKDIDDLVNQMNAQVDALNKFMGEFAWNNDTIKWTKAEYDALANKEDKVYIIVGDDTYDGTADGGAGGGGADGGAGGTTAGGANGSGQTDGTEGGGTGFGTGDGSNGGSGSWTPSGVIKSSYVYRALEDGSTDFAKKSYYLIRIYTVDNNTFCIGITGNGSNIAYHRFAYKENSSLDNQMPPLYSGTMTWLFGVTQRFSCFWGTYTDNKVGTKEGYWLNDLLITDTNNANKYIFIGNNDKLNSDNNITSKSLAECIDMGNPKTKD